MNDIVNLRQARKRKLRAGKEAQAAENRAKFGRSRAEKDHASALADLENRRLDRLRLAPAAEEIVLEEVDPRGKAALFCLGEYYAELARRFEHGYDVSLARDPHAEDMIRPRGVFLVAMTGGLPVGCAGLKGGGEIAEVKRLWVSPAVRGRGLARRLMAAVEDAAHGLSIPVLRLDTNSALAEAVHLYRSDGWTEIARFNDDPYPDAFFEKRL